MPQHRLHRQAEVLEQPHHELHGYAPEDNVAAVHVGPVQQPGCHEVGPRAYPKEVRVVVEQTCIALLEPVRVPDGRVPEQPERDASDLKDDVRRLGPTIPLVQESVAHGAVAPHHQDGMVAELVHFPVGRVRDVAPKKSKRLNEEEYDNGAEDNLRTKLHPGFAFVFCDVVVISCTIGSTSGGVNVESYKIELSWHLALEHAAILGV